MRARIVILGVVFAVFFFASLSHSGVPQMINYQGKLTTTAGALIDDTLSMVFTIYDAATDGGVLWTETQPSVVVEKGVFSVLLGAVNPLPDTVFTGDLRYLGVKVEDDPEMSPRKNIVSVGYAYKSEFTDTAEYAKTAPAMPDADWIINGDNVYHTPGNVGIGTTSPSYPLHVSGNSAISGNVGFWGTAPESDKGIKIDKTIPNTGPDWRWGIYSKMTTSGSSGYGVGVYGEAYSTYDWSHWSIGGHFKGENARTSSNYVGKVWGVKCSGAGTAGQELTIYGMEASASGGKDAYGVYAGASGASQQNFGIYSASGDNYFSGNVGIGTPNPAQKLDVAGTAQMTGFKMPTGASNGYVLTSDGSGVGTWQTAPGGIGGSGTANYIPKFTGSTAIGNSAIYQSGSNVGIGTTTPNEQLEITGNLRLPTTTSTAGIIKVGADRFIHNYGTRNTFVGVNAGNLNMTGNANAANGYMALYSNTSGYQNTANGCYALSSNTTGDYNTANGDEALYSNTSGSASTANGYQALYSNTTGYDNTANGYQALTCNTTGYYNTANGYMALYSNTTGYNNTANGNWALYFNTTGGQNTAIGEYALFYDTTKSNNTAVGYSAGDYHTSTNSTFLGVFAYPNASGYDNSMCLGYNSRITASNQVRVGNSSVTSIGGQVGWTTLSDGRYKKSTSENVPGLSFISKLKPVTYTLDVDAIDALLNPPRQLREGQSPEDLILSAEELASRRARAQIIYTGFIAQEVEQTAQELGYAFSGVDAPKNDKDTYGLRYSEFVVPLVKAVQEQQAQIQQQQEEIRELKQRIEELEKK